VRARSASNASLTRRRRCRSRSVAARRRSAHRPPSVTRPAADDAGDNADDENEEDGDVCHDDVGSTE